SNKLTTGCIARTPAGQLFGWPVRDFAGKCLGSAVRLDQRCGRQSSVSQNATQAAHCQSHRGGEPAVFPSRLPNSEVIALPFAQQARREGDDLKASGGGAGKVSLGARAFTSRATSLSSAAESFDSGERGECTVWSAHRQEK